MDSRQNYLGNNLELTPIMDQFPKNETFARLPSDLSIQAITDNEISPSNDEKHSKARPKKKFSRDTTTYKRKRSIYACDLCRLKKIKCDNNIPICGACERSGAKCTTRATNGNDYSSFDPASLAILSKVDELAKELRDVKTKLIQYDPETVTDAPDTAVMPTGRCISTAEDILKWPFYLNNYPQLSRNYKENMANLNRISDYSMNFQENNPIKSPERHQSTAVNDSEVSLLIEKFIYNVHTKNPILSLSLLREYAQQIISNGSFDKSERSCLVAICCALGALSNTFSESLELNTSSSTFELAAKQQKVGHYFSIAIDLRGYLNCFSIISAQCHVIFAIYYMYMLDPVSAYSEFNMGGISCIVFSTTSFSNNSNLLHLKERLYWTCSRCENELREIIGFPSSGLTHISHTYSFPTPPVDNTNDDSDTITKSWFYYLTEVAIRKVADEMFTELYSTDWNVISTSQMSEILDKYSNRVEQIRSNLDPAVFEEEEDEVIIFLRARFIWFNYYASLPLIYRAIHYSDYEDSWMIQKLHKFISSFFGRLTYRHRHHGLWMGLNISFARSIILSALYATKGEAFVPFDSLQLSVSSFIESANYWVLEAPDLAELTKIAQKVFNDIRRGL